MGCSDPQLNRASSGAWLSKVSGMESIWRDPKDSALRYFEHLITVFDFHDHKPFQISNLRALSRAFVRERDEHYSRYSARGLPLPTEGDLIPAIPLFASREGRRDQNWFGLQRSVREWKLASAASSNPVAEKLYEISRKLIPNYYWF